jgi:hypothetical protein
MKSPIRIFPIFLLLPFHSLRVNVQFYLPFFLRSPHCTSIFSFQGERPNFTDTYEYIKQAGLGINYLICIPDLPVYTRISNGPLGDVTGTFHYFFQTLQAISEIVSLNKGHALPHSFRFIIRQQAIMHVQCYLI